MGRQRKTPEEMIRMTREAGVNILQRYWALPANYRVNQALREFSPGFQAMYSSEGRPSIPPELSQFSYRRENN